MVWCGVVRCGVVQCDVVWCDVVWCGVALRVVVWCGLVWSWKISAGLGGEGGSGVLQVTTSSSAARVTSAKSASLQMEQVS